MAVEEAVYGNPLQLVADEVADEIRRLVHREEFTRGFFLGVGFVESAPTLSAQSLRDIVNYLEGLDPSPSVRQIAFMGALRVAADDAEEAGRR